MLDLLRETGARRGLCCSALISRSGCCSALVHSLGEAVSKKQISSPSPDQILSGENKTLINGWHGLQLLGLSNSFQVRRKHEYIRSYFAGRVIGNDAKDPQADSRLIP